MSKGFKLFRQRKDGTLGALFINRKQVIEIGVEYPAENHPTKGFMERAEEILEEEMNNGN